MSYCCRVRCSNGVPGCPSTCTSPDPRHYVSEHVNNHFDNIIIISIIHIHSSSADISTYPLPYSMSQPHSLSPQAHAYCIHGSKVEQDESWSRHHHCRRSRTRYPRTYPFPLFLFYLSTSSSSASFTLIILIIIGSIASVSFLPQARRSTLTPRTAKVAVQRRKSTTKATCLFGGGNFSIMGYVRHQS